jgi:hypothetical protein
MSKKYLKTLPDSPFKNPRTIKTGENTSRRLRKSIEYKVCARKDTL